MQSPEVILILLTAGLILAVMWLRDFSRSRERREASPPEQLASSLPALDFSHLQQERSAVRRAEAPPGDLSARYLIDYADMNGEMTRRQIDVLSVDANDRAIYIRAHCHLRGDERIFRADRVMAVRKVATGEDVGSPEEHFFNLIPSDRRPDPEFDAIMRRVQPTLGVLVWVARGDDVVSPDEIDIMLEFVDRRIAQGGEGPGSRGWNKAKAIAEIGNLRPTMSECLVTLARLSQSGRIYPLIKEYAALMAEKSGEAGRRRYSKLFGGV